MWRVELDAVLTTAEALALVGGAAAALDAAEPLLELELLPHAASNIDATSVGTKNLVT